MSFKGIFSETNVDSFSEISNTIKMQSINEIEKKKVPINFLSIYLSSILSILCSRVYSNNLLIFKYHYNLIANCLTILDFQS